MAVSRRQKENDTFSDIAQTLPLTESAKELDKASVLRVAIHYLKLRDVLADCEISGSDADEGKTVMAYDRSKELWWNYVLSLLRL